MIINVHYKDVNASRIFGEAYRQGLSFMYKGLIALASSVNEVKIFLYQL